MRKLVIILAIMLLATVSFAGEKEELNWKAKFLISDFQLKQQQFNQAQMDLQEFLKELETRGYIFKDGQVIEKPKPTPKKEEPKKEGGSK